MFLPESRGCSVPAYFAVFKADEQGRERTVNWTQQGNTVRVLGVNTYWTLRIGDEAICAWRDESAIYVSN